MTTLLLFQLSDVVIGNIITAVIVGGLTFLGTWVGLRRKSLDEKPKIVIDEQKNYSELIATWQDRLPIWIERFEKEKEKVLLMGDTISDLRRQVQECANNKENFRQFKLKVAHFFREMESMMTEFASATPILEEAKRLQAELDDLIPETTTENGTTTTHTQL